MLISFKLSAINYNYSVWSKIISMYPDGAIPTLLQVEILAGLYICRAIIL